MKQDSKPYDLEERTFQFSLSVRLFLRQHKWDPVSWSDVTQVLRSSGSVAANFVEANESISLDDKLYRLRLCRKEAKESSLWLRLIEETNPATKEQSAIFRKLTQESSELVKILHTILKNKTQG
ncbi:MAG: four helix bundle protein [Akkermansiaceae bacterium]|jgi:four helix bundle protein|tara:strand:+ start:1603 stop:1974 length:372 start_codon:yes stop_codon:yes gene_type:complete